MQMKDAVASMRTDTRAGLIFAALAVAVPFVIIIIFSLVLP